MTAVDFAAAGVSGAKITSASTSEPQSVIETFDSDISRNHLYIAYELISNTSTSDIAVMSSPFAARRKARVIAQDDREIKDGDSTSTANDGNPLVRAPSKSKKKASSRISFGLGGTSMTEDGEEDASPVFTAKKSNLSRQAIEKNALRKSLGNPPKSESTPIRPDEDRPSYDADYLSQLKSSTPSTPQAIDSAPIANTEESTAIDLASKFGSDLSVYSHPKIPTDAEIQEKKARRARLAKEESLNLNASDDESDEDSNEISLRPQEKHPETRLVRDDEDIAEGFDEYVDDGRIALGRKAEREHKQKQKSEIEAMINEAEGGGAGSSSDNDTDDTELERRQAYEAAQTRAGMDGLRHENHNEPQRPRTPPKITPLPTLNGCLEKMRAELMKVENEKMYR
ncbi:MAG: hypothetical protein Q9174_003679, partial [Haloplaca sp. 1 TL-2023]